MSWVEEEMKRAEASVVALEGYYDANAELLALDLEAVSQPQAGSYGPIYYELPQEQDVGTVWRLLADQPYYLPVVYHRTEDGHEVEVLCDWTTDRKKAEEMLGLYFLFSDCRQKRQSSEEVIDTIEAIKVQMNLELADIGGSVATSYGQSLAWSKLKITNLGNGVFSEFCDWHSEDDAEIEVWLSYNNRHKFYLFTYADNVVKPATSIARRILARRGWHLARVMDPEEFNEWHNRSPTAQVEFA